MSHYLFLFSITPVQRYIEQARKTQDLYAGSRILSHLCGKAIEASGLKPEQIIFPAYPLPKNSGYSLPNRFLAKIAARPDQDLKALGQAAEAAVQNEFYNIAKTAIKTHAQRGDGLSETECRQIKTYLTINWVFLEISKSGYKTAQQQIEQHLGAIKQARMFEQLEETGRKCAICGERNVKFYHKTEDESKDKKPIIPAKLFIKDENEVTVWNYGVCNPRFLQVGEGICAVCFAKRGAEEYLKGIYPEYDADFRSTPYIALLDAINQLPDRDRWMESTFNTTLLFDKRNYNQKNLQEAEKQASEHQNLRDEHDNAIELDNAIQEYNQQHAEKPISISPYYAALRFDGDNMGKWLAGSDGAIADDDLEEFHRRLSRELAAFAQKVAAYFNDHPERGRPVYTGGDDFLGFVSLNSLFPVMKDLRQMFAAIDLQPFTGEKLTFSAGAVVAHYKIPLAEVLKWSRTMETAAKDIDYGKDAFAIAVLKRSGEIHKTIFKWRERLEEQTDEKLTYITEIFERIIQRISKGDFSGTFLNALDVEFRKLMDQNGGFSSDVKPPMIRAEISRLVERSYHPIEPKEKKERKQALTDMTRDVTALFESRSTAANAVAALGIIDFLTRKVTS